MTRTAFTNTYSPLVAEIILDKRIGLKSPAQEDPIPRLRAGLWVRRISGQSVRNDGRTKPSHSAASTFPREVQSSYAFFPC